MTKLTPKNGTNLVYNFEEGSLREAAEVLKIINADTWKHESVEQIISHMKGEAYAYLDHASYVGRGGYYLTSCESKEDGIDLYVIATIQPFSVAWFLKHKKLM